MIIYCTGTKKGNPTLQKLYKDIIEFTESLGHSVLSELSSKFSSTIPLTDIQVYKRNLKWIDGSKCMVAELTEPSLEAGVEIAYALFHRKIPVLALQSSSSPKLPSMIAGCDSPFLSIQKYGDINEMKNVIKSFLSKIN